MKPTLSFLFLFFFSFALLVLYSGPTAWTTATLFGEGISQDRVSWTVCLRWLRTSIRMISASWVARMTGVRHQCLAYLFLFFSCIENLELTWVKLILESSIFTHHILHRVMWSVLSSKLMHHHFQPRLLQKVTATSSGSADAVQQDPFLSVSLTWWLS
jgi:hypothetical protein